MPPRASEHPAETDTDSYAVYRVPDPPLGRLVWARSKEEAITKAVPPHRARYFRTRQVRKMGLVYLLAKEDDGDAEALAHYLQEPDLKQLERDIFSWGGNSLSGAYELRYLYYSRSNTAHEGGTICQIEWEHTTQSITNTTPLYQPPPRTPIEARRAVEKIWGETLRCGCRPVEPLTEEVGTWAILM